MKYILITGCGSGLGKTAALKLARRECIPFLSPYCSTKSALDAIAISLNKELKELDVNIPVILIEPGAFSTGFNEKNISKQFNWMEEKSYYKNILGKLKKKQYLYFKLISSSNIDSIVEKYVSAVEDKRPKQKYICPKIQGYYIKAKNTLLK